MDYTFDSIAGYKAEKEELQRICEVIKNRDKYLERGAKLPKGIIFYGEAGTGKTLFSKVLARECGLNVILIDVSDVDGSVRVCRRIRRAFEKAAKRKEPSMIFFDELDKLLPNDEEEYYTDQSKTILAQLLTLIDGMDSSDNFIFVATCNSYGSLPETLVRPGRIDKKINIGKPDYISRVEILKLYANRSFCKFGIEMEELAKLCTGFTCSALETLINECIIRSDENYFVSKQLVTEKILEVENEDIPRKSASVNDVVNACRNIGHFIVARTFNNADYVLDLDESNVGNNFFNRILAEYDDDYEEDDYYADRSNDYDDDFDIHAEDEEITRYIQENGDDFLRDEPYEIIYYSKTDLLNTVTVLLGGYAAEQLLFNKVYDNLRGVMPNAHSIMLNMAGQGLFGIENLYSAWRSERLAYTPEFIQRLNTVFETTLANCLKTAEKIITDNVELIKKLIPVLVERRFIEKSECEELLKQSGGVRA
ncbi:MAG: AAA family ATPase [Candidatus Coproplasma sp.]